MIVLELDFDLIDKQDAEFARQLTKSGKEQTERHHGVGTMASKIPVSFN